MSYTIALRSVLLLLCLGLLPACRIGEAELAKELVFRQAPGQPALIADDEWQGLLRTLEARLAALGESSYQVRRDEDDMVVVAVPAGADEAALAEVLAARGLLEFIDPRGEFIPEGSAVCTTLTPHMPTGVERPCEEPYETVVDGSDLEPDSIELVSGEMPQSSISFSFEEPAATQLRTFTEQHIGEPMTVVIDGYVLTSLVIQDALPGAGSITTSSEEETNHLFTKLKYGTIPVPLELVEVRGR